MRYGRGAGRAGAAADGAPRFGSPRASLIAGTLAGVAVSALTHTVFAGSAEPVRLLVSVVAGAVVGGVLRWVQLRR